MSCTSRLARIESTYHQGRHLEAAEALVDLEAEMANMSLDQQARYCLYRGLAVLRIGDKQDAKYWLCLARSLVSATTATLTARQRQLLWDGCEVVGGCRHSQPQRKGQRDRP